MPSLNLSSVLNTDNKIYGGNSSRATRAQNVTEGEVDGRPYSVQLKMAPLSLVIYSYIPYTKKEKAEIEKKKAEDAALKRVKEAEALVISAREEVRKAREEALEAENRVKEAERKALEAESFAKQELLNAREITGDAELWMNLKL